MQSPTVDRRQTLSSPATTALPACGICRPLHYSYLATTPLSDVDAESSVGATGEEPQSLVVEVDSENFVDVGVGTDRPADTASSHSSDWLSSRHHGTYVPEPEHHDAAQNTHELELQWTEIRKLPLYISTHSQPAE